HQLCPSSHSANNCTCSCLISSFSNKAYGNPMGFFISKISEVAMALKVGIIKSSDVSKWCENKGDDGEVHAEFKVRSITYKPF
ncbi:hypothetical protein NL497_27160, partial [Klebsiella pneumoniae]|nr:hypothetical protein [Klebsiella pneumoniae]